MLNKPLVEDLSSNQLNTQSIITNKEGRTEIYLGNYPITIAILADVHNNFKYLKEQVNLIKSNPSWKVVINGDFFDADQYSNFPTNKVLPLEETINESIRIMNPIFNQTIAYVWGNHEERVFRNPSGKGIMPNPFQVFFNAWRNINESVVICEPMSSLIINANNKRIIFKHGHKAGKNMGIIEFNDILETTEGIDAIVLSHTHLPMHATRCRSDNGKLQHIDCIRTTSGVLFSPYQDRGNMYVSPLGLTKLFINNKIEVELE